MHQTHAAELRTVTVRPLALQALQVTLVAFLTAAAAQIEIPHQPVPYTFQTLVVLLAGAMLGSRNGALSQLLYIGLGLCGLPVFSGWGFGLARLLGPTGGYLLAFPVAAFLVGTLLPGRRPLLQTALAMFAGLLVIFTFGTLQLQFVYFHDWSLAFSNGFLIFSWWDVVKLSAAAGIASRFAPKRLPS